VKALKAKYWLGRAAATMWLNCETFIGVVS
jgi:hypothetical protein